MQTASSGDLSAAPRVVLADAATFATRAQRFAQLAPAHPLGDYLRLMSRVAQAQHEVLPLRQATALDAAHLAQCRQFGMPPVSAQTQARDGWRDDLRDLAARLRVDADAPLSAALDALANADENRLEALAERVLAGTTLNEDAALVPFIGAALQVHFLRQATQLEPADLAHNDVASVCPVCAMRPVASVLRIGPHQGLRYAHCALCATEWNVVRIKCTVCASEVGVHYLSIGEARSAVVRAETCDDCKSYLKVIDREKNPHAEPYADDLATLTLDVLVDEQGFARSGPNLLFHPGAS